MSNLVCAVTISPTVKGRQVVVEKKVSRTSRIDFYVVHSEHFDEVNNSCKPTNALYHNLDLQYFIWLLYFSALLSLHLQGVDNKHF